MSNTWIEQVYNLLSQSKLRKVGLAKSVTIILAEMKEKANLFSY